MPPASLLYSNRLFCKKSRFATFVFFTAERLVNAILNVQQRFHFVAQGLVLCIFGLAVLLQGVKLTLPLGGVDAVRELAAG